MKVQVFVPIVLAAAAVGAFSTPAQALKGWKLEQNSDYIGAQTILVSAKSMRVFIQRYGVEFYIASPKFDVIGLNKRNNTYFKTDYQTYQSRFQKRGVDLNKSDHVKSGTPAPIAGQKVVRYLVQTPYGYRDSGVIEKGKLYNTEMYICDQIKVPPQFIALATSIAYCPDRLGYPLRIVRHNRGAIATIWNTRSVARADVPDGLTVPKGFKRVDTELALFSGTQDDMLAELETTGLRSNKLPPSATKTSLKQMDKNLGLGTRWAPDAGDRFNVSKDYRDAGTNKMHRKRAPGDRSGEWAPEF